MSRNGAGTYSLPPGNPVAAGTTIESTWANTTMADIASALTNSLSADGQTNPVANLPMNGFHHLNVSNPTLRNQYLALGMAQDGIHSRITLQDANPNTLNGTMVGWSTNSPAAYAVGMIVSWVQVTTSTGAMTMNIGGRGAVSIFSNAGEGLIDGDLPAGTFCLGYFNGTQFQLLTDTVSTASSASQQSSISGFLRPIGGYPLLTLPSGTEVDVLAGNGFAVTPGADNSVTAVEWTDETVALTYLASAYSIAIMVDNTGSIVQYSGVPPASALRENIMLGTVIVQGGAAVAVINSPAIYGDDGYLFRDTTELFANTLISGGKITPNASPTHLDISAGEIFRPGGEAGSENSPNLFEFSAGSDISFRALAGASTLGSAITAAPITAYDPAGTGTVTALTGTEASIHRFYMLGDQFIWAYGQSKYVDFADALLRLNMDRSTYQPSARLQAATLLCEIIAQFDSTSIDDGGVTSAVISSSSQQYLFGSSQSINDAPGDGLTYGRRGSDSSWQPVANATSPIYPGNVTIEKSEPRLIEIFDPIGAGWAGLNIQQDLGFNWFNIEAAYPDDKVYFRSYNPATGALRHTTTFDLDTGFWQFPAGTTIGGIEPGPGDVVGPAISVDNEIALFNGVTGKLLKSGVVAGDVVGYDVQTTPTDTTAGHVLQVGAFGLGTTGALSMPIGTTLERPVSTVDGQTRINTTTNALEYYLGSMWNNVSKLPAGYINGLGIAPHGTWLEIKTGSATSYDSSTAMALSTALGKTLSGTWVQGGIVGTPLGGRPSTVPLTVGQFYRVFLISKPDGTCDAGFDTSPIAANLLAAAASAGFTKYRRIGWVQYDGTIVSFIVKNNTYRLETPVNLANRSTVSSGLLSYSATALPNNTIGILGVILENRSTSGQRFANINRFANNASLTSFDIAAESTCSAQIQYDFALNSDTVFVNIQGGNAFFTLNQMGWIDDLTNLLNV